MNKPAAPMTPTQAMNRHQQARSIVDRILDTRRFDVDDVAQLRACLVDVARALKAYEITDRALDASLDLNVKLTARECAK